VIKYFFTKQFLGFLAVGGLAALMHWLARLCLSIWLPFSWAVMIAYVVGMAVAFLLNSLFVFQKSKKARHAQARDFVLVNLSFFPVVWLASVQVNQWLKTLGMISHSEELAHAIAIPLPMLATFLIYKFFAFKEKSYEQQ
jgi:putative flippase GtrA